jgi:tetratricopeptide (TPR) repeat protein
MTTSSAAHDKALAELQKLLKADPKDTRALVRFAELHLKMGGASHVATACELYARAGDVFVELGFARRALSAFTQALDVARRAPLLDRVVPIARAMAKLYLLEKLPREAWSVLDTSARALIEKGADEGAARLLEERIVIDDSEIARVRLAETYFRMGESGRAISQLTLVFTRTHAEGRRDEALEVAERLLGVQPDVAIARAAAEMYLARNRAGDAFLALAKLRICCVANPTHTPTLELLAKAFVQAGHKDKAARVWREIRVQNGVGVVHDELPRLEPPKSARREDSDARAASAIDAGWDDIPVTVEEPIDPSRASFWPVEEGPAPDESGSVVSVSLHDVELIDNEPPASEVRACGVFETALEHIEALVAQGRYEEAASDVTRQLALRPRNPLLLERKAEIDEMRTAHLEGPPPALFGFVPRPDSQRSVVTGARVASLA